MSHDVITKISAQQRSGRYNIFLNDHYAFAVSETILIQFQLLKGQELTEADQKKIQHAQQQDQAYQRALNFLSYQPRSVKETKRYLHDKDVDDETIETVIAKLLEKQYLNDTNFAESFVRSAQLTTDKGPRVIGQKLREKGVAQTDIEAAMVLYDESMQKETVMKQAEKSYRHYANVPYRTRLQKVRQALIVKGFNADLIAEVLEELAFEPDVDEQQDLLAQQGQRYQRQYRRYDVKTRQQKVRQALYRRGFSGDAISAYLNSVTFEDD